MISVDEAIQLIKANLLTGAVIHVSLNEALNHYLAQDIYAPINVPSFNQSAMDGYAFRYEDIDKELELCDEIPAGDTRNVQVENGEAVRIFTGAMVPDSCDTVVMQELTEVQENRLRVMDSGLKKGGNIRTEGHQIAKGELGLSKGTRLTPAAIGFLASLGIHQLKVYALPKVALLATGDELVTPGKELKKGEVYESNTFMLQAAMNQLGIVPKVIHLKDDLNQTKEAIRLALASSDIVVLSGGISVGDYDYVRPSLLENGVKEIFYKVRQKPGKPLFFGKNENTLVFALPGNPAAALNCFYVYVYMAIGAFAGNTYLQLKEGSAKFQTDYKKKSGRAEFLKCIEVNGKVELLEGQGSDVLLSFAKANCLVYLPNEKEHIAKGEEVKLIYLPKCV